LSENMTQKISPFIEAKYGWDYGESGWNTGADENFLKFSYLFDRNVDSITPSLPVTVSGTHFLTTDNRFYFGVDGIWYSSPAPKWFEFKDRVTGQTYQFDGSAVNLIESTSELDTRLDAVELTISNLGTAAFEDLDAFATQSALDVAVGQAQAYTDAEIDKLGVVSVKDFGATGDGITDDTVAIQSAINYSVSNNAELYVPKGVYLISSTLSIPAGSTYFSMCGAGKETFGAYNLRAITRLLWNGPATDPVIRVETAGATRPYKKFSNFCIDATSSAASCGIQLLAFNPMCVFDNISTIKADKGFELGESCWGPRFVDCYVDFKTIGFDLLSLNHNACFIRSITRTSNVSAIGGVRVGSVDYSSQVLFEGCDFEAEYGTYQVYLQHARACRFDGCYFEGRSTGNPLIVLGPSDGSTSVYGTTVENCHLSGSGTSKAVIQYNSAAGLEVRSNFITNFTNNVITFGANATDRAGINLAYSNRITVIGGSFFGGTNQNIGSLVNQIDATTTTNINLATGTNVHVRINTAIDPTIAAPTSIERSKAKFTLYIRNTSGGSRTVTLGSGYSTNSTFPLVMANGSRTVVSFFYDIHLSSWVLASPPATSIG
jgi:hypothetical protein